MNLRYLDGKRFAFSIVDDSDGSTVSNVKPVYDFLTSIGIRVTKTAWVYPPRDAYSGQCLQDDEYLAFIRELQASGHEIGRHNVGSGRFSRAEIVEGFSIFRSLLGAYPALHANHASNPDNLYWIATSRFGQPMRLLYAAIRQVFAWTGRRPIVASNGEAPHGDRYWGDLSLAHIRYVRNLTFSGLNTLADDPRMPYHDPRKPLVHKWFSSSDGHTATHFRNLIEPERVDQLERSGGACIVYTHFTDGFIVDGRIDPVWSQRMIALSRRPGWFVPTTQLLDHLAEAAAPQAPQWYLRTLEYRWLLQRLLNFIRYRR